MTSQRDVLSVLTTEWMSTVDIARQVPQFCRGFYTHRCQVYNVLNIMWKHGEIEKSSFHNCVYWRLLV